MARIARHYGSRFTTVVGFQPTGWSHTQSRSKGGRGRRRQKGTLITYQVPHWLNPRTLEPSSPTRWPTG